MVCEEATPDDARLIALAPDLLQAAELGLLLWGQLPRRLGGDKPGPIVGYALQAAINKATGEGDDN